MGTDPAPVPIRAERRRRHLQRRVEVRDGVSFVFDVLLVYMLMTARPVGAHQRHSRRSRSR